MKSVMKNYIEWYQVIPNNIGDIIFYYEPTRGAWPVTYPFNIMDWYSNALDDSSVLKDQVQGINMLKQLQSFYQERSQKTIEDRRQMVDLVNALSPAKAIDTQLRSHLGGLSWAKWNGGK